MVSDDQLRSLVADALNISTDSLLSTTALRDLPDFDSVQLLTLTVVLSENGIRLPMAQIGQVRTFGDILALPRE